MKQTTYVKTVFIALFAAGCTPATRATAPTPAASVARDSVPADIRWYRRSAEQRAIYRQTFDLAGDRVTQMAQGRAPQSWAIITDADETVLDNSEFEEMRAVQHRPYSEDLWATFVRRQVSTALPGAVEFFRRVHQLGGRVVVVTNRADSLCAATRSNLQKVGLDADLVLCKPPKPAPSDKDTRFRAVQEGTAAPGVPALHVVAWLGDNIQDFPHLKQAIRTEADSAFEHFGRDYFVFPNPMYGSWEQNPN